MSFFRSNASTTPRSRKRVVAGVAAVALTSGLTTAITGPAGVAHAAGPIACPDALPTASAVDGLTGTGYTVERGTTPAPFTARLLGRITDGIAPDVDMIMAELSSPAIDKAGVGVWAGMSGSPVYTEDGRLIGAVSYGLATNSPIAGITPAADMKKLLGGGGTTKAKATVTVSGAVADRIAKTGGVTKAQATAGFTRLRVPVTVSGVRNGRTQKVSERLAKKLPGVIVTNGSRVAGATAVADEAAKIIPGGNFGAAVSYGAVSLAGVGTTTFVCDGTAIAFGHPFIFEGQTRLSAHSAEALFVQPDAVWGSFKVANFGGVAGTVDSDRTAGIRAKLGTAPAGVPVTSAITTPEGETSRLSTTVVGPEYVSLVSVYHAFAALDKALDKIGAGSAALTLKVKGVRADGSAFTVTRTDHYTDPYDVGYFAADAIFGVVDQIEAQHFEKAKITSVSITGSVSPKVQQYRVTSVKVKKSDGTYGNLGSSLKVTAGKTVTLKVALAPYRGEGKSKTITLKVAVPKGTQRGFGQLTIATGPVYDEGKEPNSFSKLLSQLKALPTNDSVRATLDVEKTNGKTVTAAVTTRAGASVREYEKYVNVTVKK